MKKFDLISIGDTTLDVFLGLEDAKIQCDANQEDCLLCVAYPDKVAVKSMTNVPAVGNAANVAVGEARLGLKSAFYTILGEDSTGKESFQVLKKEGVYKDYIQFDKTKGTNYSVVLNFQKDRTILVYHELRNYNLPALAKSGWVYLTSIGPNHQKLHQQVIDYVEKTGAKLGFNPGTHQLKEGLEALKPLIKKTAVLFVNKEEAQRLLGNHEDIKKLLQALHHEGANIVVITDGQNGSYSFDGTDSYFLDILKWPDIERTGCGDAYSTGFMAALHLGHDITEAMRWGTANAASVLQKIGAREGLLHRQELLKILADNPQLKAEKI
jgi:ribokinase